MYAIEGQSHSVGEATAASRKSFHVTWAIPGGVKTTKTVSLEPLFRYVKYVWNIESKTNLGKSLMTQVHVQWIDETVTHMFGLRRAYSSLPLFLAYLCHCLVLRKWLELYPSVLNSTQLVFISNLATASYNTIQSQKSGTKFHPMWTSLYRIIALEHKEPVHKGMSDRSLINHQEVAIQQ